MLAGGGPIVTTLTGGTGEAVGDTAVIVEPGDIAALAEALDRVVLDMSPAQRRDLEVRARERAMSFDRVAVFDGLFPPPSDAVPVAGRVPHQLMESAFLKIDAPVCASEDGVDFPR